MVKKSARQVDCYLHLGDFGVVQGLAVPLEGCRRVLEQHQDFFHTAGRYVEVNVPQGIALVAADFALLEHAVIQYC